MSWEKFILRRLRFELPKKIKQLRRNAHRTVSMDHYVVVTSGGHAREITLDLEDRSKYSSETLEQLEWRGYRPAPRPIEDQLERDGKRKLLDKILERVSASDCTILVLKFGLDDSGERSVSDLATHTGTSRATAHRRVNDAVAHARDVILLSQDKLAELTCTTDPARQMAVLRWLEVVYEPPKQWLLHSRAPDAACRQVQSENAEQSR